MDETGRSYQHPPSTPSREVHTCARLLGLEGDMCSSHRALAPTGKTHLARKNSPHALGREPFAAVVFTVNQAYSGTEDLLAGDDPKYSSIRLFTAEPTFESAPSADPAADVGRAAGGIRPHRWRRACP